MKYAIVTGGARGLGLGIVRALLQQNVVERVAVLDRELQAPPAELAASVDGFAADVTDEAQVAHALEALTAKLGPHPDVLCNNAGGGEGNWFEQGRHGEWHSVEVWRRYVDLNLNRSIWSAKRSYRECRLAPRSATPLRLPANLPLPSSRLMRPPKPG